MDILYTGDGKPHDKKVKDGEREFKAKFDLVGKVWICLDVPDWVASRILLSPNFTEYQHKKRRKFK